MGLMYGTGPLGPSPAGAFSQDEALYLEPCAKRVRVVLGDEVVADSRHTMLLHEAGHQPVYYFPPQDVVADLLEPSERHTRCPRKGTASYYTIRVGDRLQEAGAWYYPEPIESAPPALKGMIAFYFRRMDRWLEEDEEIRGHPRDPYHRIDVRASSRRVRVSLDGTLLADSSRPTALFETGLPVRWYLPREDLVAQPLRSDTVTHCPYKGDASYFTVDGPGGENLIWCYADPMPGALPIKGLLCFWNERVDLEVDGELLERPESPFTHAARPESRAGASPPARAAP